MFIETSAKAGHNVKTLFKKIAQALPGMDKDAPGAEGAAQGGNQSESCHVDSSQGLAHSLHERNQPECTACGSWSKYVFASLDEEGDADWSPLELPSDRRLCTSTADDDGRRQFVQVLIADTARK